MNGWECKLSGLPDFAVISGPNGSGKTVLLKRIMDMEQKGGNLVIFLNWESFLKFRAEHAAKGSPTGALLLDFFMLVLKDIEGRDAGAGRFVVLVDDASGLLDDSQMNSIYTKLMELYFRGKIFKAYVTRVSSDTFKIRNITREGSLMNDY